MAGKTQETGQGVIKEIKRKVKAMLSERHSLRGDAALARPSDYWSDFCSYFDYLLGMEDQYYAKLRLHTYHLTSDNYQFYYFTEPGMFGGPEGFRRAAALEALTRGLPVEYVINEPEGGIGFRYEGGRFVSYDVARFQRVIASLYRQGVFRDLGRITGRPVRVLEIGAGYGGLAHHLSALVGRATYYIMDLPEVLLYSAAYLSLLNPQKKLYLYDPAAPDALPRARDADGYDFVLLPNYRLGLLAGEGFDLSLNVGSMQEMRTRQAEEYLDFIRAACAGPLYSWNEDRQAHNREMSNLTELLVERFSILDITTDNLFADPPPGRLTLRGAADRMLRRLMGRPAAGPQLPIYTTPRYREYLCRPLPSRSGR